MAHRVAEERTETNSDGIGMVGRDARKGMSLRASSDVRV
jgi:hypothetical protein